MIDARTADADRKSERPAHRLEATQCHTCKKLLCENTRDAIRPGKIVAIKCGRCNAMNYLMGTTDAGED